MNVSDYLEDLRLEAAAGFITAAGVVSAMAAFTSYFRWVSIAVGGVLALYLIGELWGADRHRRWLLVHAAYLAFWCLVVASVRAWFLRP